MANIGTFKKTKKGMAGTIHSLTLNMACTFEEVTDEDNEKAPDYRIRGDDGIDLGAAWKRTNKEDKPYLSVKLDDPVLPSPLYATLVEQDGDWNLVWVRQSPEKASQ